MFPVLTVDHHPDTILYALLRWIVLVELVQNAWSYSVCSTRTKLLLKQDSNPWSKEGEEQTNEHHQLDDVFMGNDNLDDTEQSFFEDSSFELGENYVESF